MLLCFLLQQQHLTFYDSKSNFMFMMKIPFMTCILLGMEHKKKQAQLESSDFACAVGIWIPNMFGKEWLIVSISNHLFCQMTSLDIFIYPYQSLVYIKPWCWADGQSFAKFSVIDSSYSQNGQLSINFLLVWFGFLDFYKKKERFVSMHLIHWRAFFRLFSTKVGKF